LRSELAHEDTIGVRSGDAQKNGIRYARREPVRAGLHVEHGERATPTALAILPGRNLAGAPSS
jgi:hypothetical protein